MTLNLIYFGKRIRKKYRLPSDRSLGTIILHRSLYLMLQKVRRIMFLVQYVPQSTPKYWEKHDNMDNKFLMWDVLASFSNNYYGVISHRNKKCWMVNLTHFGLNYCLKNPILSYFSKSLTLETSASVPNFGVWLGENQFWILAHKKLIWKFI